MILDLQKASILKRFSAALLDIILILILSVGFGSLISLMLNYDSHFAVVEEREKFYAEKYDVNIDLSTEELEKMTEKEWEEYKTKLESIQKDLSGDKVYLEAYSKVVNLSVIVATFGILLAVVVLEVVLPIILKNGQTVGKKIFGIAVMRIDSVKISPLLLVVRSVLGKFTIEIMFPVLIIMMMYFGILGGIGLIVVIALLILQIVLLIATKNNSVIHDLLSSTVAVDLESQMIFDTQEALIEYKKKIAAEEAEEKGKLY